MIRLTDDLLDARANIDSLERKIQLIKEALDNWRADAEKIKKAKPCAAICIGACVDEIEGILHE
jgi:hypothetical protein